MPPLVVIGRLGWANGDRSPVPRPQLDAYGPGGRWGIRSAGDDTGRTTKGDHLADALTEAGATEGDRLVVLVLPRNTPDDVVQRAADLVLGLTQPRLLTADELGAAWWHGPPSEMPDDVGSI